MPWDPTTYNQFKDIRLRPFLDLMSLISGVHLGNGNGLDIGCGTGEQTAILADKFRVADFLGIDSSVEMLAGSGQFVKENLHFELTAMEPFIRSSAATWDLIFSNAALQWSNDHRTLFPELIAKLNPGGQFAVQMPFQTENSLNRILLETASEKPFADWLNGFIQKSPLLQLDEYAQLMFDGALTDLHISLRVYPIIAANETDLYQFISGSALIPYMERLDADQQKLFRSAFIKRIQAQFVSFPAIYAFKRLLLYGVKRNPGVRLTS
ncbi:methyltransferase domain-containing protein [Parapedobacter lycopersici]|uniref:methyltransferase domain-containing protein n=1 Tax=Parapedobacter lycopersici TaxID=1864939 RepID=UPI00333FA77B